MTAVVALSAVATGALGLCLAGASAQAASLSFAGSLGNPQSTFEVPLIVGGTGSQSIIFQTWGFGGGINAAGTAIAPGGFDPLLAVFAGAGASAPIVTANLNPAGTSDTLSNYTTGFGLPAPGDTFVGCPPAGLVGIGSGAGSSVCGDIRMSLTLAPGVYTVVLADANYQPNAIFDNGTLGAGFADFTGGAFQTCNTNAAGVLSCITPSANFAFDVTSPTASLAVPEPGSLLLLAAGLFALALGTRRTGAACRARQQQGSTRRKP